MISSEKQKKHTLWLCGIFLVLGIFIFPIYVRADNTLNPEIKVYLLSGEHLDQHFNAFDQNFRGGVFIATGDIVGDERSEIIAGAGPGGGPHVRIFNSQGSVVNSDFFPFHHDFRGGVSVAAGDLDGDGHDELIFGQASMGQAWVKVYKRDGTVVSEFRAFDEGFRGGVMVSTGDVNGDGIDEILAGTAGDGRAHVRSFNRFGDAGKINIFPFHPQYDGGVSLTTCNIDDSPEDEIIIGAKSQGQARVIVYDENQTIKSNFLAYHENFVGGVSVACGDQDGDRKAEIITGAGGGGSPHVRMFTGNGVPAPMSLFPFPKTFWGGVHVASGNVSSDSRSEIIVSPRWGFENHLIVGNSRNEKLIEALTFGSGDREVIYIGGTHAGVEPNSVQLMEQWATYLKTHPWVIPRDAQAIIIQNHNPDGYAQKKRTNAAGVDINRNFGTLNWSPIAYLFGGRVNPGPWAFSEPESRDLAHFLLRKKPDKLITYHSNLGYAFAGKQSNGTDHPPSLQFAQWYNARAGNSHSSSFTQYSITGDLGSYGAQILGIPSITVELQNRTDFAKNLPIMIDALK